VSAPLTAAAALSAVPMDTKVNASATGTSRTSESMTRFERARILGARALQVSLGAPILIDVPAQLIDPVEIAEREFSADMIPITVRRGPRTA
jgi:DNA-directed RNA polymerase subunit K